MPKVNSKRARAMEQLTIAQDALAKALNFLGGKPRGRSSKLPATRDYTSRSYIVSCIDRLDVAQVLIESKVPGGITTLRDDFERDYDKERRPQC